MDNINYKIIFSKRRTVSLIVTKEGELVVRAPKRVAQFEIQKMVESRRSWIEKHLEKASLRKPLKKQYVEGERFWYLGGEQELRFKIERFKDLPAGQAGLKIEDNKFFVSQVYKDKSKLIIEKWYRAQAKDVISSRAEFYVGLMNVKYKSLKITGANTRWGSCSASGNINFSYRLIMAPISVVDYVVVHELAHIVHKNHSQSFWQFVGKFYPNFKEARKWLNTNSHKLVL